MLDVISLSGEGSWAVAEARQTETRVFFRGGHFGLVGIPDDEICYGQPIRSTGIAGTTRATRWCGGDLAHVVYYGRSDGTLKHTVRDTGR